MEEKKLVSGAISSDSNVAIEIVAPSHVASLTSPATQTNAAPSSVPDENDKVGDYNFIGVSFMPFHEH
jgi:hypothetical protein